MLPTKPFLPVLGTALVGLVDSQPYLVVGAFILTLIFGWRAFKVRDFTTEIQSLKAALNTAEIVKKTDDERRAQLEDELRGAQERANVHEELAKTLRMEIAEWRKRYDERAAGTSLAEVQAVLIDMARNQDHRHEQMLDLFARLAGEKSVTQSPPSE